MGGEGPGAHAENPVGLDPTRQQKLPELEGPLQALAFHWQPWKGLSERRDRPAEPRQVLG